MDRWARSDLGRKCGQGIIEYIRHGKCLYHCSQTLWKIYKGITYEASQYLGIGLDHNWQLTNKTVVGVRYTTRSASLLHMHDETAYTGAKVGKSLRRGIHCRLDTKAIRVTEQTQILGQRGIRNE